MKKWILSMQCVPNSSPSDREQSSKYSNGSLLYIYLPRNGSLSEIVHFGNIFRPKIYLISQSHYDKERRKKDNCVCVALYRREMVDSSVPMLRSIGVVMASASHATYSLQQPSMLCYPWNFLEHFLCTVCCSGIRLD